MVHLSPEGIYTWGAAAWSTTSDGPALGYESEASSLAIHFARGQPRAFPSPDFSTTLWTQERDLCWELLSSLTLWFIWRARCFRVFEGRLEPAVAAADYTYASSIVSRLQEVT